MLEVIHIVQIILAFVVAGATGMQTTMPQYDSIWSPIQLLATTVLTVLGLVSNPIGGSSVNAYKAKVLDLVSAGINKIIENSTKVAMFIGVTFVILGIHACIPNPLSQYQTFENAYTCIQQNYGEDFAQIEATCLPGQADVVADIILDIEAIVQWAEVQDAGTADANGVSYRKEIFVTKYASNPTVQARIQKRGLVLGK
jgi:hypothetical protein